MRIAVATYADLGKWFAVGCYSATDDETLAFIEANSPPEDRTVVFSDIPLPDERVLE